MRFKGQEKEWRTAFEDYRCRYWRWIGLLLLGTDVVVVVFGRRLCGLESVFSDVIIVRYRVLWCPPEKRACLLTSFSPFLSCLRPLCL